MDKGRKISIILVIAGIILALTSATLMLFGSLPVSARITILIVGLALMATSNFRLLK